MWCVEGKNPDEIVTKMYDSLGFKRVKNEMFTEEQINNGVPHNSNPGYSYSKRTGQIYTKLINGSTQGYFKYVNLIPTNLYGNRDA